MQINSRIEVQILAQVKNKFDRLPIKFRRKYYFESMRCCEAESRASALFKAEELNDGADIVRVSSRVIRYHG